LYIATRGGAAIHDSATIRGDVTKVVARDDATRAIAHGNVVAYGTTIRDITTCGSIALLYSDGGQHRRIFLFFKIFYLATLRVFNHLFLCLCA
jgi:hypothetical protein